MQAFNLKLIVPLAVIAFLAAFDPARVAFAATIPISQQPLFTQSALPPLMMLVMSRDEQLFIKAYTDYTDLHAGEAGDTGAPNTTYDDTFDYTGYFGSNLCYSYSGGVFKADNAASGTNSHSCSSEWSGNFLNWVTMTRLDIVRSVLYGGLRSTDTATQTVLERAAVPNDVHAWAKVYSGADISSLTPYSGTTSFCNASYYTSAGRPDANGPQLRVASGDYSQWAATERHQCDWSSQLSNPGDGPASGTSYTVRVDVCDATDSTKLESFCRQYTHADGTSNYKPAGLLQEYGENGSIRFGLMTGSYSDPRSGGRLRRNIGTLAGNSSGAVTDGNCKAGDEIDTTTGKFCNQSSGTEGIINTLNRFQLVGWSGDSNGNGWYATIAGSNPDCAQSSSVMWGIINRNNPTNNGGWLNDPGASGSSARNCNAWGNPLSEIYAEAVRYIEGNSNSATSGFVSGSDTTYIPGIPDKIDWIDPYGAAKADGQGGNGGGNPYCATCSILVLSTGLNSFDSDEIPTDTSSNGVVTPANTIAATNTVGADEGINGGSYLIGRVLGSNGSPAALAMGAATDTATDVCTGKVVDSLSNAIGLCPDIPSLEGSYYIAGLAYKAWTTDLRPDLIGTGPGQKPDSHKNVVKTFSVALAESLPNFTINVSGSTINFSPLCVANPDSGKKLSDGGFHACSLAALTVGGRTATVAPKYTYGQSLAADGSAGSYSITWEDSTFGSDHDQDAVEVLTYCVGSACSYQSPQTVAGTRKNIDGTTFGGYDICWRSNSPLCTGATGYPKNPKPTVAAGTVLMRVELLASSTGDTMATGFSVSGTASSDGAQAITLGSGNASTTNVLTGQANPPSSWDLPQVMSFTAGTSSVKRLQNPLWYAAKYGSFDDLNNNGVPDEGEWDKDQAGVPDNFFQVTNPAKLQTELKKVFDQALKDASPTASTATSTPRFVPGGTLAYQVSYNAADWTGDVEAYNLQSDGTLGTNVWNAKDMLPAPASRNIATSKLNGAGTKFVGIPFTQSGMNVPADPANPTGPTLDDVVLGPLTAPYNISDLISYLRGDQSQEQSTTPPGPYRTRSTKIGDILNSTPAVQGQTTFAYGRLPTTMNGVATGAADYKAFVASKSAVPTVYVGSNDGMLHAFDGGTATATGGVEKFAYIPNAVLGNLNLLAQPSYSHTYYVDGSPVVGDAYNGTAWQTVLLGSTGAGGRSVYALNITQPDSLDQNSVMWEFNDQLDTGMGQALVQPALGLTEDGKWSVAFGNGYNSASKKAILYVRNLWTGGKIAKINTGVGSNASPNGMTTATMVDTDGDGAADTIYAGDYQGNMWKFVYDSTVTGGWKVGNGGLPIFQAVDKNGKAQSITSGVYTVANPLGGTMVEFGTGRYLSTADSDPLNPPNVDTVYSIWDANLPAGTPCTVTLPTAPTRADLQEQDITGYTGGYISSTQNAFDFRCTSGSGVMGWYIDLTYQASAGGTDVMAGNRVLAAPTVILGTLLVNTFQPEGDICVPGGNNFLLELDALSGAANYSEVGGSVPTPPAGSGTGGTLIGSGPPQGSPLPVVQIPTPPTVPPLGCNPSDPTCTPPTFTPSADCKWTLPNPANKSIQAPIPCGRVSWRQLR